MTFYEYETRTTDRTEFYALRANGERLASGGLCIVEPHKNGWKRTTKSDPRSSTTRVVYHATLDEALAAGIKWAKRKEKEK